MRVKVDFNPHKVKGRLTGSARRAQAWLDNTVVKDSTPYVPRLTGALERSGIAGTKIGSGLVEWNSPYARYQYYGKVMVDPAIGAAGFLTEDGWFSRRGASKVLTGRDLQYSKQSHPKACRLWFEAAKSQNKAKWLRGAKKIGGGDG